MGQPVTRRCIVPWIAAVCLAASWTLDTRAEPQATSPARGEPFSDPQRFTRLPDDWRQRPMQYNAAARDADLVVSLGQQTFPALHGVIEDYAKQRGLNIVLEKGTCGISAGKLLRKTVDIGAFCCPPGETDRLPGLQFHTLGIAPIALLVHRDNPVSSVSSTQAREIFQGKVQRWTTLRDGGGSRLLQQRVQPVGRLHCKLRPGHWRLLLSNEDQFSPRLYEVGVIPDMIAQVARNQAAIGYETLFMVKQHGYEGRVKILEIDNFVPSNTGRVLSGNYPLYRTYNLTTWENDSNRTQLARKLIQYLIDHMERKHDRYGFIPPSQLRAAGWKFQGDELIGEPQGTSLHRTH